MVVKLLFSPFFYMPIYSFPFVYNLLGEIKLKSGVSVSSLKGDKTKVRCSCSTLLYSFFYLINSFVCFFVSANSLTCCFPLSLCYPLLLLCCFTLLSCFSPNRSVPLFLHCFSAFHGLCSNFSHLSMLAHYWHSFILQHLGSDFSWHSPQKLAFFYTNFLMHLTQTMPFYLLMTTR